MKLPYTAGNRVRITSAFGFRTDPISGEMSTWHGGLDLVGLDDKSICAPVDGMVLVSQMVTDKSNRTWEWGNYVCISGNDGNLYYLCHLAKRIAKAGDYVKTGDIVGVEGSTGYSTGNHCHLEVRRGGVQINPTEALGIDNKAGAEYTVAGETKESEDNFMHNEELDNIPNEWAEEAVEWAIDNGILKGHANGNLALHECATREDMIVFLYRTYKLIENK